LSELFTLGNSFEVLSPTNEASNGAATAPWSIRPVIGHGTLLGRAVALPFLKSSNVLAVSQGPMVGHDGVWLGSGSSVYLVNASTGALMRSEHLGGVVASISIDPTGHILYVVPDPVEAIDELDAQTGRVLVHDDLGGGLASAGVDAVRSGIYPTSIGSTVWLQNITGTSCANPTSGAYLAGTAFHTDGQLFSWSPFADWNGRIYATAPITGTVSTEIISVAVPRLCR
jgi:hypothetical protein